MPTTGIEPVTFALRERRSTTELNRHNEQMLEQTCHEFRLHFLHLEYRMNTFVRLLVLRRDAKKSPPSG